MSDLTQIQEQSTAGPIAIAFDYQFYCFIVAALEMKTGDKVGFEVKDDIHIEKANGKIILQQLKHTVSKDSKGNPTNLTTLDSDLWKTLSRWTDMINAEQSILDSHSFCLVTNKGENKNEFIDAIDLFKSDGNISNVIEKIKKLKNETKDKELKTYIKNILSLGKKRTNSFLTNLTIETNYDNIIARIKQILKERYHDDAIVDAIFNSLYSNISANKYLEIKEGNKFEISLSEFSKKYGRCFKVATELKPLPKRNITVLLPEDLESQMFIKQLLDIGELQSNSSKIRAYTTQMLRFLNHFTYWSDDERFLLFTDVEEFKKESIIRWSNKFTAKYRNIEKKINSGSDINDLEDEIKNLGIEIVDYMREQDLSFSGFSPLGIDFSNGHYYALSDNLEIGWHFDWKNKYKKE